RLVHPLDLHPQVVVDEGALLQAARHRLPPGAARAPAADDQGVGRLLGLAGPALGLAPRRHRGASAGALALAPAERVVARVHGHATGLRALAPPAGPPGLAQ